MASGETGAKTRRRGITAPPMASLAASGRCRVSDGQVIVKLAKKSFYLG